MQLLQKKSLIGINILIYVKIGLQKANSKMYLQKAVIIMKAWCYRVAPVILLVTGIAIVIYLLFIHVYLCAHWQ
ncbi:hypothetical protein BS101_20350 [Clostridium kluyveri]|uniref:Uncharacterized protein n=1 Tax=Clostridium kluyveri TaxID=1534 RepID=A0A1L5FCZ6_CLOKL|nr:hypothetical protein BS101_20350 [Clostridium kluyveri]